jgi:hypothetical protein
MTCQIDRCGRLSRELILPNQPYATASPALELISAILDWMTAGRPARPRPLHQRRTGELQGAFTPRCKINNAACSARPRAEDQLQGILRAIMIGALAPSATAKILGSTQPSRYVCQRSRVLARSSR